MLYINQPRAAMHFLVHRADSVCLQITGDDTPALQAVLDADVWRTHLLREQEVSDVF